MYLSKQHQFQTKVRSHGNNVCDVIIAHVISADAHTYIYIYRHGNRKVILGPAGRVLRAWPAGKKKNYKELKTIMQLVEYYSLFSGSSLYNFAPMYSNDREG